MSRSISEGANARVPRKDSAHSGPLHAFAATMNDPDLAEALLPSGLQVGIDDVLDFGWIEGVQVDRVLDRKHDDGLVFAARVKSLRISLGRRGRLLGHGFQPVLFFARLRFGAAAGSVFLGGLGDGFSLVALMLFLSASNKSMI